MARVISFAGEITSHDKLFLPWKFYFSCHSLFDSIWYKRMISLTSPEMTLKKLSSRNYQHSNKISLNLQSSSASITVSETTGYINIKELRQCLYCSVLQCVFVHNIIISSPKTCLWSSFHYHYITKIIIIIVFCKYSIPLSPEFFSLSTHPLYLLVD